MKKILALLFITSSSFLFGQNDLDLKIDKGNDLYNSGDKEGGLKTWQDILNKAPEDSSTYGTTLRNVLWYYIEAKDEKNIELYYNKIINSKLNDKDPNAKLDEPYKNYRYHSTMVLASYYAKKADFEKALKYVNIADHDLTYETTSLASFKFQKVDLAFWKYRLYKDLKKPDSALYVLIKRAFEYDYKDMYKNWATYSAGNDEKELAEEILTHFTDKESLQNFKAEIKKAIETLTFANQNGKTLIKFKLQNFNYEIVVHSLLSSKKECTNYLEKSYIYLYLQ